MDLNEQKEQLSYAYIHLVASAAGCTFAFREDGDALGIDITIMGYKELQRGISIPIPIDAQVKSTSRGTIGERYIHYDLKVKNYNGRRTAMTTLAKDYDILRLVYPSTVASFLTSLGWREAFLNSDNKYSYWVKNSDEPKQVALLLPMDNTQLDYPLRMTELLQRLAALERRSESEIVDEWLESANQAR